MYINKVILWLSYFSNNHARIKISLRLLVEDWPNERNIKRVEEQKEGQQ